MELSRKIVKSLSEVAEIKRIFSAVKAFLDESERTCIVVTSAARSEGKTVMSALLGTIAAQRDSEPVLAVDLNWHNPTLLKAFGLENALDLQAFSRDRSIEGQLLSSGIDGLDILPAPSASDPLVGERSPLETGLAILSEARAQYKTVIVDTSSIFPTNRRMIDPVAISSVADAVALVVLAGVTPRHAVKRGLLNLELSGARVAGTIVNQWRNPLLQK